MPVQPARAMAFAAAMPATGIAVEADMPLSHSDASLLVAAQVGDHQSAQALGDAHSRFLCTSIRRRAPDVIWGVGRDVVESLVEDVVIETWRLVYPSSGYFDPTLEDFRQYLRQLVRPAIQIVRAEDSPPDRPTRLRGKPPPPTVAPTRSKLVETAGIATEDVPLYRESADEEERLALTRIDAEAVL